MQNVKDGCLRQNELLQILWVEVKTIHVHCREEDGFHLVVTKLICWLVSSNQNLVTNIRNNSCTIYVFAFFEHGTQNGGTSLSCYLYHQNCCLES